MYYYGIYYGIPLKYHLKYNNIILLKIMLIRHAPINLKALEKSRAFLLARHSLIGLLPPLKSFS
jgi:hypothetical protein